MSQCLHCRKEILSKSAKKFCGSSCAASHNNKGRKRTDESKQKTSNSVKLSGYKTPKGVNNKPKYTIIAFCTICGKVIRYKRNKSCSKECYSVLLSSKRSHIGNRTSINYNGVKLGSSFELKVAISLDKNNVKWTKPKSLPYKDSTGKIHSYYPDFYLPDYNIFLDPKNDFLINNINPYHGFKDTEKILWVEKYNNVKVLVLNKNQLDWNIIQKLLWGYSDSN